MTDHIKETAADVAALIPQFSWQLMDEEQRDALMEQVVLPRYMQTTSDGVKLTPTFWATAIGASAAAVRNRIQRLQKRGKRSPQAVSRALSDSRVRHARSALREAEPDQIKAIISELPAAQAEEIGNAVTDVQVDRARARLAEEQSKPTAGSLMGGEKWDPAADWLDTEIIGANNKMRSLAAKAQKTGAVLGSMSADEALAYMQETERLAAEVRVIFQERVRDGVTA